MSPPTRTRRPRLIPPSKTNTRLMKPDATSLNLIKTGDGSMSLYHAALDETYHSRHGAIAESQHVFIQSGLSHWLDQAQARLMGQQPEDISILEMGFGTGLNALLTRLYQVDVGGSISSNEFAATDEILIHYQSLEAYPLLPDIYESLAYSDSIGCDPELFLSLHKAPWNQKVAIAPDFSLTKNKMRFEDFSASQAYDLVYYDAFGARVQPELWEMERFLILHKALRKHGVLVTYAAKGSVRRALQEAGFAVERLPGPPGKREMLRGTKI